MLTGGCVLLMAIGLAAASAPQSSSSGSVSPASPTRGVWAYFCYEDTASIDGSSPTGHYSAECWKEQSVASAKSPAAIGTLLMAKWIDVEPSQGVYDWSDLDKNLTTATAELGLEVIIMIMVCKGTGSATPAWLHDKVGVPNVEVMPGHKHCPYYLDPAFQDQFALLIKALAAHIAELPASVQSKVVAGQAALGITGDDRPYAGTPVNADYIITPEQWKNYTKTMAMVYCNAFASINRPVLFNLDNPGYNDTDDPWIVEQCPGSFVKQGIVSHGYQLNTELDLYQQWQNEGFQNVFSRGELALEPNPAEGKYGSWTRSPYWSLQANAEWALTFGLGAWNLYSGFLGNSSFLPTLEFFNRHAPSPPNEVATAAAAFVSFRDSLDTDDVVRFPESQFGPLHDTSGHTSKLNQTRLQLIANAFEKYGALLENAQEAASMKSVVQKKGMHLNDVGYRIWPGNYHKFMAQNSPATTSVGHWRLGPLQQGYGRFARGLEQSTGKTAIQTLLANQFASTHRNADGKLNITCEVVYFDEGSSNWTLTYQYNKHGARAVGMNVRTANTGRWQVAKADFIIYPAASKSNRKEDASGKSVPLYDFELRSVNDQHDAKFSILEVVVNDFVVTNHTPHHT